MRKSATDAKIVAGKDVSETGSATLKSTSIRNKKRLDLNKPFDQRRTTIASQHTLQTSIAASQTKKFVHTSVKYKRFVFQLAL